MRLVYKDGSVTHESGIVVAEAVASLPDRSVVRFLYTNRDPVVAEKINGSLYVTGTARVFKPHKLVEGASVVQHLSYGL